MINLEKFKRNKISIRIKEIESELSSTINNKSKLVIIKINSLKKELKTLKIKNHDRIRRKKFKSTN